MGYKALPRFIMVTGGYKSLQGVTGGYKRLQGITRGNRGYWRFRWGYKG